MTDDLWLVGVAWRLDRLRWVPSTTLIELVTRDGACMYLVTDADVPPWNGDYLTDRELAERLCAVCRVPDECLELELRTAGADTVGVWGALAEDDRRTVHRYWLQRGERAPHGDWLSGGPTP